jgi:hypothetical protein
LDAGRQSAGNLSSLPASKNPNRSRHADMQAPSAVGAGNVVCSEEPRPQTRGAADGR